MKTPFRVLISIVSFCLLSLPVFSQDIIMLRTGDEIKAVVSEVDINQIKYKKFENPNGPQYVIEKSKVFFIKYQNGTKDVFNQNTAKSPETPIQTVTPAPATVSAPLQEPPKPVEAKKTILTYRSGAVYANDEILDENKCRELFSADPEILQLYNSGSKQASFGSIVVGADLGFTLVMGLLINKGVVVAKFPQTSAFVIAGVAVGGLVASAVMTTSGKKKIKKAVLLYNKLHAN